MSYEMIETDYNKSALMKKKKESQPSLSEETRNELMHYGVLGMRWGIRRYQPYGSGGYDPKKKGKFVGPLTAKGHERKLNKTEWEINNHEVSKEESISRASKYAKRYDRVKDKNGKIAKKLQEIYQRKMTYEMMDAAEHETQINNGKRYINDLLKNADAKGYLVTSYQTANDGPTQYYVNKRHANDPSSPTFVNRASGADFDGNKIKMPNNSQPQQAQQYSSPKVDISKYEGMSARKKAKLMSDEELKAANDRLNAEQTLIRNSSSRVSQGADYYRELANKGASDFLQKTMDNIVQDTSREISQAVVGSAKKAIKNKISPEKSFTEKATEAAMQDILKKNIQKEVNKQTSDIAEEAAKQFVEEYLKRNKK